MSNIHHKKIKATNKSPEIKRFVEFLNSAELGYADLVDPEDLAERTIAKYVHENMPIGGQLLRILSTDHGVSIDWILTGKGYMYVDHTRISESAANYENEKPLIPHHETTDTNSMQDFWWLTAKSIEQSIIQSGAKPGNDYSILDLYKLAKPIVTEQFKKQGLEVTVYKN